MLALMSRWRLIGAIAVLFLTLVMLPACDNSDGKTPPGQDVRNGEAIHLPEPRYESRTSVEEALAGRRSVREYSDEALTLQELSQLLWAAQGITGERGFRTAPSAGALYPLEIYVVAGNVEELTAGVYLYSPREHQLLHIVAGDRREELCRAALDQECVKDGAVDLVIMGVYERTTGKYGDRGVRYVHMEAGHAAQNVYLQAESLELGTVVVGGFEDDPVSEVVGAKKDEIPLYIVPIGKKF